MTRDVYHEKVANFHKVDNNVERASSDVEPPYILRNVKLLCINVWENGQPKEEVSN